MIIIKPGSVSCQVDFEIGRAVVEVQQHGITRGVFDRENLLTWIFNPGEPLIAGQVRFALEPNCDGLSEMTVSLPEVDRYRFSPTELIELQVRLLVWGEDHIGTWFHGAAFG